MNTRDRKHIFIAFFKVAQEWVWCYCRRRSCHGAFVPPQPSGSEGQTGNEHEERERLLRVLKQMGRIKCPSEVCGSYFSPCHFLFSSLSFFATFAFPHHLFPFCQFAFFTFVKSLLTSASFDIFFTIFLTLFYVNLLSLFFLFFIPRS